MLGHLYENQDCSAARALELVGERWSLLILRDAIFRRHTRFSQFRNTLGVATNILTKRLEGFVAAGLMERRQREVAEDQVDYVLTEKALDLKPVIIALSEWGDKWVSPGPVVFCNERDDEPVSLQLMGHGGAKVSVADVVVRPRR
jgi:DNA-binding HxlR family transcriptional regulator